MSGKPIAPHFVDVDEKATRRTAACTVAKAYLTAPQTWGIAAIGTGVLVTGQGAWSPGPELAVAAPICAAYTLALVAGIVACSVYFAPRTRRRRLCYLRTADGAQAALLTREDPRRGARPGDVQAAGLGSWPKKAGAGRQLGGWLREQVHADGGRVTLTATPLLAPTYRRNGLVDDGRTAFFLIRLASKPVSPKVREWRGEPG